VASILGSTQAWQQAANVEVTVEKAPRWRKVVSCSKERFAICSNVAVERMGLCSGVESLSLIVLTRDLIRLLSGAGKVSINNPLWETGTRKVGHN